MRVERLAGLRVDRQLGGVEQVGGVAGQREDAARQARETLAGVQRGLVPVEILGEVDLGAGHGGPAVGGAGRQQRRVVGVVVVDAGGAGAAAGDLGDDAGEGVRRRGGPGVGVLHAAADQPGQRGLRVLRDVPGQVRLVQAVDRDQQYVLGGRVARSEAVALALVGGGLAGGGAGQHAGGAEDGGKTEVTAGHGDSWWGGPASGRLGARVMISGSPCPGGSGFMNGRRSRGRAGRTPADTPAFPALRHIAGHRAQLRHRCRAAQAESLRISRTPWAAVRCGRYALPIARVMLGSAAGSG